MTSAPEKKLLRFMTCGSVDDGKSTLIGRMLYEAKAIYDDQLRALERDSRQFGTQGDDPDFALLVDGLAAEREQGITIDIAHRFFSTNKCEFIVADTPGHEQYTRNMATAASTADLAIVIVDAQKGIRAQTRRHSLIASLLGVPHIVLAINKIDLVDFSQDAFEELERHYREISARLEFKSIKAIPVCALNGDNISSVSPHMPWYAGPSLLEYLESVDVSEGPEAGKYFRMPVQLVCRPNTEFRGFSGQIASGSVSAGDPVVVLPSGKMTEIRAIVTHDGDLPRAGQGKSVVLTLKDDIDVSRGDVISSARNPCEVADIFKVSLLWMCEKEMVTGRQYIFRSGTLSGMCMLNELDGRVDTNTFDQLAAKTIGFNEIGICSLFLNRAVAFEPYQVNRVLGSFVLIDRVTHETVGMGMIKHALRRSRNVQEQKLTIDKAARSRIKNQIPCVIWMTGISGAGKSTIADILEQRLWAAGKHTIVLDGDNIRRGLSRDLGFTEQARAENVRRAAEVGKLMVDAGLVTIVSFISPFRAEREMAKEIIGSESFIEVFVDTPLEVAEARDVKGLYKKARAGEIPNFTGIGSPYEAPEQPDIHLKTIHQDAEAQADIILRYLEQHNFA